jgi:hypothetical protein
MMHILCMYIHSAHSSLLTHCANIFINESFILNSFFKYNPSLTVLPPIQSPHNPNPIPSAIRDPRSTLSG